MTVNHHPKAAVHAIQSSPDPLASQGARRATEEASGSAPPQESSAAAAEVVPHARRRQFSNADKRRILDAADRCTRPGEIGALMRQEGVYSSSLSTWRRQREAGDLAALAPQKRGPKIPANRAETLLIAQLTRERDGLQRELDKAMLVIGVQKKLATLLDTLNDNSGKP
jgi:transposase